MSESERPLWQPMNTAAPAGWMAPAHIQCDQDEFPALLTLAAQILDNSLEQQQLVERVYQLLKADLRHQQERQGFYGAR